MANKQDIVDHYLSGASVVNCSKAFDIPFYKCQIIIRESGSMRTPAETAAARNKAKFDKIFRYVLPDHKAGLSVKQIHEKTGYDRGTIKKALEHGGIKPRNRSEAMLHRMSLTTPDERMRLTENAHKTIRAKGSEFFNKAAVKQAITKEMTCSKIGGGEKLFADHIGQLGFSYVPQKAISIYNIDIMVGNLAVEIHNNTGNPHNMPANKKRIEFLLDCGFDVLYVKTFFSPLAAMAANYAVSMINEFGKNPPGCRQYRMIRGDGEIVTTGHFDSNHSSLIITSG